MTTRLLHASNAHYGVRVCVCAAPGAAVSRATVPTAMVEESAEVVVSAAAAATTLIATQAGDFGGYTLPIIGLAVLAATIGILAGPVED